MTGATLLIVEAAVVVAAAPLCGLAMAVRQFRGGGRVAMVCAAIVAVSLAWTLGSWGLTREAASAALTAHVTLVTAALALGAVGAWCGSTFRDPLDAVACSLALALAAAIGLFAAGPVVADLPTSVVNALLTANPIVATASAANIDLLRTELLYQLSPVAHRRFDYPAWYAAPAWYTAVMLACGAGIARTLRKAWL